MEVTQNNFTEVLPQVKESIDSASFIAIDCEFSGLNTVYNINAYDTQKRYYEKVRAHCKDFLVLQFGLCTFRWDEEKNAFKQRAYNFYIFRRPINRNVPDVRFLCQTSSIDFLITQGFDFNKLFKDGISYLNTNEESKYRDNLIEQQRLRATHSLNKDSSSNTIAIPPEEAPFIDDVLDRIKKFLSTDDEEIVLPRCNAFVRRLIYQTVHEKLANKVTLESRQLETNSKDRVLVASKLKSKEALKTQEQEKVEKENKTFDDVIGFSKVIKLLVESNKLVVGHNMCLDLLQTIDKFLIPLPADYEEFKECAHHFFSNVLDTKYMSSKAPFKDLIQSNVLGHMLKTLQEDPFKMPQIEIEDGFKGYLLADKKEHEAGYDAFITGLSFVSMYNYLYDIDKGDKDYLDLNVISPYLNKLFLMRLQDFPCINLAAPDTVPSRDHVLYITFPREWKMNDIVELFSPFGNVYIAWINEISAFVGLAKREQASVALSTLSQSDRYHVMTFAQRQAVLDGVNYTSSPLPAKLNRKRMATDDPPASNKRRSFEEQPALKRKRLNKIIEQRRSIEPILEEQEETDVISPGKSKSKIKTTVVNKTFDEADWD